MRKLLYALFHYMPACRSLWQLGRTMRKRNQAVFYPASLIAYVALRIIRLTTKLASDYLPGVSWGRGYSEKRAVLFLALVGRMARRRR